MERSKKKTKHPPYVPETDQNNKKWLNSVLKWQQICKWVGVQLYNRKYDDKQTFPLCTIFERPGYLPPC